MKKRILVPVAALAAAVAFAAEPEVPAGAPRAKLAQVIVNAPLPDGVPFDVKPSQWDKDAGYVLTYVVKGTGLAEIDGASLKIASATAGGADISVTASGRPACRVGPAMGPRVASGGEWGTFSIEIHPEGGVKGAFPVVHGTIDVICATGVSEKSVQLAVAPFSTAEVGKLTFKSVQAQSFFGNAETFGVTVEGNASALASLEVSDGGRVLKSNGHVSMNGTTTYHYPQPSSSTVTLWVSLREGNARQTVRF